MTNVVAGLIIYFILRGGKLENILDRDPADTFEGTGSR
jgi:hypothetical protein